VLPVGLSNAQDTEPDWVRFKPHRQETRAHAARHFDSGSLVRDSFDKHKRK